jgi:class 3 adenylate cyclase
MGASHGRYLAGHIANAVYRELPGTDHIAYAGDADAILDEVEEFLTTRRAVDVDRVLATVLFDIVASTQRAAELGDRRWRAVLESHDRVVRERVHDYRGRVIRTTGDGVLSTFDGPARAIRCASAIQRALRDLGIEIRAGIHTGEIELREAGDIGGIAVHIASRVMGLASAGEILVSRTVVDRVVGSGLSFIDRGGHELKGVPGSWTVYASAG